MCLRKQVRGATEQAEVGSYDVRLCQRCKSVDFDEAFKFSPEVCEAVAD